MSTYVCAKSIPVSKGDRNNLKSQNIQQLVPDSVNGITYSTQNLFTAQKIKPISGSSVHRTTNKNRLGKANVTKPLVANNKNLTMKTTKNSCNSYRPNHFARTDDQNLMQKLNAIRTVNDNDGCTIQPVALNQVVHKCSDVKRYTQ